MAPVLERRTIVFLQKHVIIPVGRRVPLQTLLETTGRKSGLPRQTPVGGSVVDGSFWFVSEHGSHAQYVRNIKANPHVRMRIRGRWHTGTAHLVPTDDPIRRLRELPQFNSAGVRAFGTELLTVRVDLDN